MIPTYSITLALGLAAVAKSQNIGSAASFAVLGASTVTSTGETVLNGERGVFPGTAITGFPPGISGTEHRADAVAQTAQKDAQAAYTAIAALPTTEDLTGADLGGLTLKAGVYGFSSSVGLTGILTLDGGGDPNSRFVFKIGSTLITATGASVILINGAQACNLFWQVGSSATLGMDTAFVGYVIAQASVTVNAAVVVNGGLYALTAAVTMINDAVNAQVACNGKVVPPTSVVSTKPSVQSTTSAVSSKSSVQSTTSAVTSKSSVQSTTSAATSKSSVQPTTSAVTSKSSVQPTTFAITSKSIVQPTSSAVTRKSSVHPTTLKTNWYKSKARTSTCVRSTGKKLTTTTLTYTKTYVVPTTTTICHR